MDPQKLSQLDPKLRDAYQRVMGTTIPQPQAAPAQAQTPTPPAPIPNPPPTPDPNPVPATPNINPAITPDELPTQPIEPPVQPPTAPIMPEPTPVSEPQPAIPPQPEPTPTQQANNFVQMNSEVPAVPAQNFSAPQPQPQTQTVTVKKKNGMMIPILFGIAGLVFIVIYTLFWTKIFNFKLPFFP